MDRMLTNEEKLEFMKKVLDANYLSEIEQAFLEINKNNNTIITKEEETTLNKDNSNDIDVASIYAKEAMPFVKEDLKNHSSSDTEQVVEDFASVTDVAKEGPVLKRTLTTENKVPNPWGESGAKLVSPGEKLDY